jgi:copper(I)-binding protein
MYATIRFIARRTALAAILVAGATHVHAATDLVVKDAWVRATVPAQKATGAFMRLQAAADRRLVAASSPAAGAVEVHEMAMLGDVMRMRQIASLPLPANRAVELKPGGYHLMLLDLKRQAKEGDVIPLSLVIEDKAGHRETVTLDAPVRGLASKSPEQAR